MCPGLCNLTAAQQHQPSSYLLELAAADDLPAFRQAVQENNLSLVAASPWYGPSFPKPNNSNNRPQLQLRTPAMVAALYGSTTVLSYVLSIAPSEAARASSSDGATPLLLAHQGRAPSAPQAARLLINAGADPASLRPLHNHIIIPTTPTKKPTTTTPPEATRKPNKDYSAQSQAHAHAHAMEDQDINAGVFATDEFRMYSFKVKPCSRAYTHDWTECPFAHPGENARRRDPLRVPYSCVPCPDFRRDPAACRKGDGCEYAHGVFESWLHPAQYRTRLCKDEVGCPRRICFFAHGARQLRAVNPSAASMASPSPSPTTFSSSQSSSSSRPALTASLSSRDLDLDTRSRMRMPRTASPPDYSPDLVAAYVQALSSLQQQNQTQNQSQQQQQQQQRSSKPPMGLMSARAAAFTNRSQTFVHRSPVAPSLAPARSFKSPAPSVLADWGSPDGKLEWGVQGAELRKSSSFGVSLSSRPHDATNMRRREDNMYSSSWMNDGGSSSTTSDMLAARWSDLEQMVA